MAAQDGKQRGIARLLPAVEWLPRDHRRQLRGDVIAGIAVTALVVPKNLGYAGIAGVPLQNGLYAAAAGAIVYAQVLIPPDSGKRKGERPGWTGGRYSFMRRVLATELGQGAIPETTTVNRAGLRSPRTQPTTRPFPPTRQDGRAHRVAINHHESQP